MRRLTPLPLLAAGLLGGLVAPTAAVADPDPTPVGDACRDAGANATLCAGADQLVNAGKAWCREYLVCTQPSPDEMDPWLAWALADQRGLGDPLPLAESFWFGTHNSYNSPTYGFSVSRNDPNQRYSIGDQLDVGARFLELDVHWFLERPVVCHARGEDEGHAGCSVEQTIEVFLDEIATWLDANPDEVVALRIEDHLGSDANRATVGATIRGRLGGLSSDPDGGSIHWPAGAGHDRACEPWPMSLSRQEIRDGGAQVLLVTDECGDDGAGLGPGSWFYANDEGGPKDDCSLPTFIRAFEDATWLSTATGGGDRFTPEEVAAMLPCVNQLDLDMLDPHDERLPALVWSWAPGAPVTSGCVVDEGRFRTEDCVRPMRFACQAADGSWSVTDGRGPWRLGDRLCDAQGLGDFDVPRTAREAAALRAIISGTAGAVWVDHRA